MKSVSISAKKAFVKNFNGQFKFSNFEKIVESIEFRKISDRFEFLLHENLLKYGKY